MSAIDQAPSRDFGDLVKALIEEALQRARRRRRIYGGAVFSFAVAAVVFATMKGPAQSQSSSPAAVASPNTPVSGVVASVHVYHLVFTLRGKRGGLDLAIEFPSVGTRSWLVIGGGQPGGGKDLRSGQYDLLAGAHGKHVEAGGHASAWHARLVGFVTPNDRGPKQRVLLKLKGRPEGTFTLVPLQTGVLKHDSGTQTSHGLG